MEKMTKNCMHQNKNDVFKNIRGGALLINLS
jgi:hypothetical protein